MSSRDWALTVFLACVIAVIALAFGNLALAIFVFLGVLALAWAIFDPWLKSHLFDRNPKTEQISSDPTNALVVSRLGEQWTSFHHKVRFLKIHYAIKNRTNEPIQTENWKLEISGMHHGFDREVSQERERLRREFPEPPHMVAGGARVEGWWVVELEYGPGAGEPEYRLTLHTATGGHEYGFRRIGNPKVPIGPFVPTVPRPAQALAPLQLRHEQREPYLVGRFPERPPDMHYVGIYNPSGNPAITRVLVEIQGMDPLATDFHGKDSPEFPAAVPRKTGGAPSSGVTLQPDTEELWEIATAYSDGQGQGNFFVQGISMPAWPLGRGQMWSFHRGDRWRLYFQVSADGLPSRSFRIVMEAVGDIIRCELEGVTP